jgi:hypothetical protein
MCDYSLHGVKTQDAKLGDELVLSTFPLTHTRGFTRLGGPCDTAICLKPGTQLAFERPVEPVLAGDRGYASVAVFGQRDLHDRHMHHDILEFADGRSLLVTSLVPGQVCRVLQLPVQPQAREGIAMCMGGMNTRLEGRTLEEITAI